MVRPIGYKLSSESKKKISEKRKGMKFSPEHIENLRKSHLGKKLTENQRKKISESNKGRLVSSETREKIRNATKGKKRTQQGKKNISIAQKKRFADPKEREKSRLRGLEIQSRLSVKEKTSKSLKATYSRPEMREMQKKKRYMVKYHRTPKNEKLIQEFLTELNIPFHTHYNVRLPEPRKYAEADIIVKSNKIIDIRGDRYHANPKFHSADETIRGVRNGNVKAGDLQKRDKETLKALMKEGYKVLVLWEHEFVSRKKPRITPKVKRKILNFLNIRF